MKRSEIHAAIKEQVDDFIYEMGIPSSHTKVVATGEGFPNGFADLEKVSQYEDYPYRRAKATAQPGDQFYVVFWPRNPDADGWGPHSVKITVPVDDELTMPEQLQPYRPSNGEEGRRFMAEYCDRCAVDAPNREFYEMQHTNPTLAKAIQEADAVPDPCWILGASMGLGIDEEGYPRDTWVYFNGKPTCLAFRDKDDGDPPPEPAPNQPDLFEELPVLQPA